jgi:hypothetical protein
MYHPLSKYIVIWSLLILKICKPGDSDTYPFLSGDLPAAYQRGSNSSWVEERSLSITTVGGVSILFYGIFSARPACKKYKASAPFRSQIFGWGAPGSKTYALPVAKLQKFNTQTTH